MAIFHHFLTFLATFLVVTTTFMDKTCAERTQTLVTCMVGGTDPFCPSPGSYVAQGGVQKMAILGVKTGVLWRACKDPTWKLFYAPYHVSLHSWTCIWAIFDLSMHIYGAGGVQNMAIWGVKAGYHGRLVTVWVNSSGKCLVCHITSLYMAKHQLGPFMSSRGTFMAQGGSKKWHLCIP